jgi:hypothetical protein
MHPVLNQSSTDFQGKSLRVFFFAMPCAGNHAPVAADDASGAATAADLIAALLVSDAQTSKPAYAAQEAHKAPSKRGHQA